MKPKVYQINDEIFFVKKSTRKNKKYDVFDEDLKKIVSFGDTRYEHYKDKIGHYKHLDHGDEKRRENYLKRSQNLGKNSPYSANWWSRIFLW